ncbi:group 1 glycosyl transferase [Pseudomonas saudimassiliensis]|uniref:Group 1 glycosyl transferase n=1 Tax=Pseudomonas saudimassiliensis TaxID=1461581 RepID=A0A078MLI4_9PSED|nr:glycosyltransferase [Pseudomonas saudimassiliensis]CEA06307.1 group 1 glycosyl transferase [Pseudomonas saudimassiliensis]CEF27732.1 group 1 glycosyl transferase [Pseudomonas saudimassiliensis]
MNLAYIHDHKYYRCNGKVYSAGTMSSAVFSRFFGVADKVTVFSHLIDVDDVGAINSMTEIDDPRVSFSSLNDFGTCIKLKDRIFLKKRVLKKIEGCDGVVARVPGTLTSRYCRYLLRNTTLLVGLEVVGCTFDALWYHGSLKAKLAAIPSYFLMRNVVRQAQAVVYVTEGFLQTRYPTAGKSVNASNVVLDSTKGDKAQADDRWSKVKYRFGIVGSWDVAYKGHDVLFKSLSQLPKDKFQLDIVGLGDANRIHAMISVNGLTDNVTVVGRLKPGAEMMTWYESLDLLVHPSRTEGLPRSVIEAMSRGCPVLASSVGGIPELLPQCRLHSPGDHKALEAQLLEFLENPKSFNDDVIRNIVRSKDYLSPVLEERRLVFWQNFFKGNRCSA